MIWRACWATLIALLCMVDCLIAQELIDPRPVFVVRQFWNQEFRQAVGYTPAEIERLEALEAEWKLPFSATRTSQGDNADAAMFARKLQEEMAPHMLEAISGVSPERYSAAVKLLNRQYLAAKAAREGYVCDPSFLLSDVIQERLGVTGTQRLELLGEHDAFKGKMSDLESEYQLSMEELWREHFRRTRQILGSESRRMLNGLIGEPIQFGGSWEPSLYSLAGISSDFEHSGILRRATEREPDFMIESTNDSDRGADSVLRMVLASSLLQDQLELSGRRQQLFFESLSGVGCLVERREGQSERLDMLISGTGSLPTAVEDVLSQAEIEQVMQMELQVRLQNWKTFGIFHPAAISALSVSNAERELIDAEVSRFEGELSTARVTWTEKAQTLVASYLEASRRVLTEEQKRKVGLLVGAN